MNFRNNKYLKFRELGLKKLGGDKNGRRRNKPARTRKNAGQHKNQKEVLKNGTKRNKN